MRDFEFSGIPTRAIFGKGAIRRVGEVVLSLGASRPLVIATARQMELIPDLPCHLGAMPFTSFPDARLHTPVEITRRAQELVARSKADCLVAIGGGSAIGLGKALSIRTGLPQVAIPTTYAGSEATDILGETESGRKQTRRDPAFLPRVIIYDPDLSVKLPRDVSIASGFNAIAHAAEALYARDCDPLTASLACEAIRNFTKALPAIAADAGDITARGYALYAAWLCGICLRNAEMGLHHKLCHTLGGMFGLPHAEMHMVLLAHSLEYNAADAPVAMARMGDALGTADPALLLHSMTRQLRPGLSLRAIGMPEEGIEAASVEAIRVPYPNPRPITREGIRTILTRAFDNQHLR